jgi:hypothetical protein
MAGGEAEARPGESGCAGNPTGAYHRKDISAEAQTATQSVCFFHNGVLPRDSGVLDKPFFAQIGTTEGVKVNQSTSAAADRISRWSNPNDAAHWNRLLKKEGLGTIKPRLGSRHWRGGRNKKRMALESKKAAQN